MNCGFTHWASGNRSLGIGQRSSLLVRSRAPSSSLSVPERAMKAEPAYAKPCAPARTSNARGAFVLRSRAVPMMTNEPSVKHLVLSQVLLRPLRHFEEASLETIPSSWWSAQARKNASASPVNSSLNRNGGSLGISFFSFALRSAILAVQTQQIKRAQD